jgi:hypothetical protein
METRYSNARLSIHGMGDVPAFVIKEDARAFVMVDGMGHAPTFIIKGDVRPTNVRLLYLHNQRRAIGTHVSLLSQKRGHLGYKLN